MWRPRIVPFALKRAIDTELTRSEEVEIVEKVSHSDWAAPIVPVPKNNCLIRICGDYKVTVTPVLRVDQHPLPHLNELYAVISERK